MDATFRQKYSRIPLIIGFILNIIITITLFIYFCTILYTNFSWNLVSNLDFDKLELIDGVNGHMALSIIVCFIGYFITSFFCTLFSVIKKEPLILCLQCFFDFLLGAFKLIYDYLELKNYNSDDQLVLKFLLISTLTFVLTSAIFETTLRKHHKPKIFLLFDLLTFLPVFLPTIISFIQTKIFNQTDNLIIVLSANSNNLITTITWIAIPNFVVLYCAQFSADVGLKKVVDDGKRLKVIMPLTLPEEENESNTNFPTSTIAPTISPVQVPSSTETQSSLTLKELKNASKSNHRIIDKK